MNKKTIITILLALVAMAAQAQTFTWRIEGTVANAAPTDTLTVIDAERQRMITTLQVKDGNIVPASGTLDEPAVCCITKQGRRGWIRMFVLESGTVNITVDLDLVYLIRIGGTPMNDEFGVFHKHGTQNSALFLIDCDGTIIAVPNSVEELKEKLEEIFPDNK